MEPIATIITALTAGAAAAANDMATTAVKDAYQGLKAMVVDYWKRHGNEETPEDNQADAESSLRKLKKSPDTFADAVAAELKEIMPDPPGDILARAQALKQALEDSGQGQIYKNYQVTIKNAKNINVGEGNTIIQIKS